MGKCKPFLSLSLAVVNIVEHCVIPNNIRLLLFDWVYFDSFDIDCIYNRILKQDEDAVWCKRNLYFTHPMFGQFKSKYARKKTNDIGITEDVAYTENEPTTKKFNIIIWRIVV